MKFKQIVPATLLFLSLTVSATAESKPKSDAYLDDSVRQKFAAEGGLKGARITVEVKNGVVTLSGTAIDSGQKSRAERAAKKVKGVKSVVDNIQLQTQ